MIHISCILTPEDYKKAKAFIKTIKPLLITGDFQIEKTEKNIMFDRQFSLTHQDKSEILKSLTADDCYKIEPNNNSGYQASEIYKFFKEVELTAFGESERTKLYLKMYVKESKAYDIVIVISFHEEGLHEL